MKKLLSVILLSVGILVLGTSAQANLISFGDFTGATLTNTDFVVNTASTYNKWLGTSNWAIATTGGNPDSWGQHVQYGWAIYQGITGPAPGTYEISLDYIYENIGSALYADFYIVGLNAGSGVSQFSKPTDPNSADTTPGTYNPGPPYTGTTLFGKLLVPPTADAWTSVPAQTFTVTQQYDAWAFIVWAQSVQPTGTSGEYPIGLEGIDNVNLQSAAVPEPTTMLLLGSGLIGLWGLKRQFMK